MLRCLLCGQEFARQFTLNRHIKSKHEQQRTQHQCLECHEFFARHDILERHTYTKHGDGMEVCSICSQRFRKDYLAQHKKGCERKRRFPGQKVLWDVQISRNINQTMNNESSGWLLQNWLDAFRPTWTDDAAYCGQNHSFVPTQGADLEFESSSEGHSIFLPQSYHNGLQAEQSSLLNLSLSLSNSLVTGVRESIVENRHSDTENSQSDPVFPTSGWGVVTYELEDRVHYDTLGRVEIDHWPSNEQSRPPVLPFVETLVQTLGEHDSQARLEASMEPCLTELTTGTETGLSFLMKVGQAAPSGYCFLYAPAIKCLDCDHSLGRVQPNTDLIREREHLDSTAHKCAIRLKVIAKSETIKEAVGCLTAGDRGIESWNTLHSLAHMRLALSELDNRYFDTKAESLLILAVKKGDIHSLRFLLAENLDVERTDSSDRNALHWACAIGRADMAEPLLDRGLVLHSLLSLTPTPLDLAVGEGHLDTAVGLTVRDAISQRDTPLVYASTCGHAAIIKELLATGADPNEAGRTERPLNTALLCAPWKAFQLLLDAGANPTMISIDDLVYLWDRKYCDAKEKIALLKRYGVGVEQVVKDSWYFRFSRKHA